MANTHQLPEWFLNHNTIMKANFDDIHPNIEVVDSTDSEAETYQTKLGNGPVKTQPSGPTKSQISSDTFSMFRDIVASAFVRNSEDSLDPTQSFVILEAQTLAAPIDFLDELVKSLVKEIGASLISFDLEDLEDLGIAFSQQTPTDPSGSKSAEGKPAKNKDKKRDWNPSMAKHWFSASSETDSDARKKAWERTQRSYSTIFDAIPRNQAVTTPEDGDATETTRDEQDDLASPILVHVRETSRMLAMEKGWRFLGRLCDCIQERRENGQAIAVVLTIPKPNVVDCSCPQCVDGHQIRWNLVYNNTCATTLSNHRINPINDDLTGFDHTDYIASVNLRRLKRVLRQRMCHLFDPELLHPHADWKQLVCKEPRQCFGDEPWSWDSIHGAFLQISGRSFGKQKLEVTDILLVLSRLGLHKHERLVENQNPEPAEEVGEDSDDGESMEKEKQAWDDKMAALHQERNSVEKNLVDCVINLGESEAKAEGFSIRRLIPPFGTSKTRSNPATLRSSSTKTSRGLFCI